MIKFLFWAMTLITCGYAALLGGRDGRLASALIIVASLLTIPATRYGNAWASIEVLILGVDLALLVCLYALSLKARSFFPIWMTGFHLMAVTTHISTLFAPEYLPQIYRALSSFWAVPMTLAMVWGIHRDRRMALNSQRSRQGLQDL